MKSRVQVLEPGRARVVLADRRRVRNHLGSIHAVAIVNLGEFTSGLAFVTAMPTNLRGIVTELKAEYLKKARGTLTAESTFDPSTLRADSDQVTTAEIADESGDIVARVTAVWSVRVAR